MFENETAEAQMLCQWSRAGMVLGGMIAAMLYLSRSAVDVEPLAVVLLGTGLGLNAVAAIWAAVYGGDDMTQTLAVAAVGFAALGFWREGLGGGKGAAANKHF